MDRPVCIVTGAGRGIGQAAAVELDRLGYSLVLVARTTAEIEQKAASLQSAMAFTADVSESEPAGRVVEAALSRFGRVDALVNNAGYAPVVPVDKMTDAQWRQTIDVNLSSVFYYTRAVWGVFKQQRRGVVVNISSLASRDPFLGFAGYAAAKAGVNLFSMEVAREGAPLGIRVHVVAPGAVETRMLRTAFTTDQVPADRTLAPEDIGRVIAQCVAGDLRHTSGEVIYVHK